MRMTSAPIRIFVVEKDHLARIGLVSVLSTERAFVVVGQSETLATALSTLAGLSVNVFLLRGEDNLEACHRLRATNPQAGIILIGTDFDDASLPQAIDAGVNGCCRTSIGPERLIAAIYAVRFGDLWIDSEDARQLLEALEIIRKTPPMPAMECSVCQRVLVDQSASLTYRENEVLQLIVGGQTNQAIANSLLISLATVKAHVRNILSKLDVEHRTQAAVVAVRRGLA